jgi:hypothetical protein
MIFGGKMKKSRIMIALLVLALLLPLRGGTGYAQDTFGPSAPLGTGFTYQGQISRDGQLIDSACDIRLRLYDAETAGGQVGADITRSGVGVSKGLFTLAGLDFGSSAFNGEARWLEVAVRCSGEAGVITLSPRQALSAAPYAIYALKTAPHDHWGQAWSGTGTGLTLQGGSTALDGRGTQRGLFGQASNQNGYGVYGAASSLTGAAVGVYGVTNSTSGYGVDGYANAASGGTIGVRGRADSPNGYGVYGLANSTTGANFGVYGRTLSNGGYGLYGLASSPTGITYGVYGEASSINGRGVFGRASTSSGGSMGVFGQADSTSGQGVFGYASASSGFTEGVIGRSDSTSGKGVTGYAWATSGATIGVHGAASSPSGYGVYGVAANINSWGVFAAGKLGATGTKSAVVETQDYGWRLLYSIESPKVLFEDLGTAELQDGLAVVTFDPIFAQTANLSGPYQVFLTPGGDCGLYVAEKTPTSFTVRALGGATCSIPFDYRVSAPRLGYEQTRLESAPNPMAQMSPAALEISETAP